MGLCVDIVGYSARSTPLRNDAQHRISALVQEVLGDLLLRLAQTDWQSTGDGMSVVLPATVELHHALPVLLRSWQERLARDNQRFRDRLRLRMAVGVGPVSPAPLGSADSTIIELSRLVDSDVLRQAVLDHPYSDLVVLVSGRLYSDVVGEGYPGLDAGQFQRRFVQVKQYAADAWLWIG
jgi:hypothetical protein